MCSLMWVHEYGQGFAHDFGHHGKRNTALRGMDKSGMHEKNYDFSRDMA